MKNSLEFDSLEFDVLEFDEIFLQTLFTAFERICKVSDFSVLQLLSELRVFYWVFSSV